MFEDLGCYNSDVVDLSITSQDYVILNGCKDAMELGSMHCLASQDPGDLFQHGPRQGNLELHQSLANFLNEEYGHQVSSDHLFITGGSSQGLVLLCNALFQSGDPVFVADPTGSFLDIFRDLGLKVVSDQNLRCFLMFFGLTPKWVPYFRPDPDLLDFSLSNYKSCVINSV
ncbi:hypothetical protein ACROYT_G003142 [Oculina patagonica]